MATRCGRSARTSSATTRPSAGGCGARRRSCAGDRFTRNRDEFVAMQDLTPGLAGADRHAQEARERCAGSGRQRPAAALLLGLLAGHDRRADEAAAESPERLRRELRHAPRHERQARKLVVDAESKLREDLAAEPARPG